MFGDLDWPLNASRAFVSISWTSCSGYCATPCTIYIERGSVVRIC